MFYKKVESGAFYKVPDFYIKGKKRQDEPKFSLDDCVFDKDTFSCFEGAAFCCLRKNILKQAKFSIFLFRPLF